MSGVLHVAEIVARQALNTAVVSSTTMAAAAATSTDTGPPACEADNDYDGRLGVRISAIFVILFGSICGAVFPTYAARHQGVSIPSWAFFIAKYFGSGVIVATAFIHLLAPANDALTDPCLTGPITEYDWVEGIALMTIFVLFFTELMAMRFAVFGHPDHEDDKGNALIETAPGASNRRKSSVRRASHTPGEDHLSHVHDHVDNPNEPNLASTTNATGDAIAPYKDKDNAIDKTDSLYDDNGSPGNLTSIEDYRAQMTAIFILEFGVIFHSIFVGLTLAVAGSEFNTLYVVLVFHQTFEGLGLGSRLAVTPWPKNHQWTPYLFGMGYAFSTPISMAVGLGVRETYAPGSQTSLIVNGVFDSISAGILIYTGLVELMAHEFMFSATMRRAPLKNVLAAFFIMCLGAGLMALLGKWA